ncbi:MAG: extracellular solute-binding protein [Deltaproteobacteria bacterium]|nr:extracellular solute-binding protein [Deltaproteobacteria bacterium]MBI2538611.1 extracellular solute-binding protein [Deltaproteobacteria bacterium]
MRKSAYLFSAGLIGAFFVLPLSIRAAQAPRSSWQAEWDKAVEGAKKEGRVVVSVPASAEVRKGLEEGFKKRFGLEVETVAGRGAAVVRKIVEESRAGVRYFDLHIGGSESIVTGFLPENILQPVEPWLILPEVKEAKNWWGGHIWVDNARRYVYSCFAYQTVTLWHNSDLMKAEEVRSFDDFLNPKLKGKIGWLDPRTPGSGASMWTYLMHMKGEEYLKRLAGQKLALSRDQRVLAEILAKGKVALVAGLTYYSLSPFLKAGLPVKPLPTPREGLYASGGSGHLTIMKNPPHANGTKVFVNWLLSKEGQEIFSKAIGQGTRRLDVDTKWLQEFGVLAAKDGLTLEQYYRLENQSEEKVHRLREPGAALARKLLD